MTPRQAKLEFKHGRLRLRRGAPSVPTVWNGKPTSEFQRRRLLETFPILREYLVRRRTVKRIATELGVTYQRVEQILAVGVSFAEKTGWFVEMIPIELAGETTLIEKPARRSEV